VKACAVGFFSSGRVNQPERIGLFGMPILAVGRVWGTPDV
jgi:hypothetical protein